MNIRNHEIREFLIFFLTAAVIIGIFSFVLFGMAGIRVFAGIIFISLPFYLILTNLEFTEGEKIVFSLLLGFTIFPSLVYLMGLVMSFRIAILITFIVFIIVAFLVRRYIN